MWKWIAGLVLALVVGFVFGRVTDTHHEKYGHRPPYHNEFSQRYNDRGMGPQWMGGPFNNGPMMGRGSNGQPMDMRLPNPCNNMPGNCGCCNRPGNDDNRCGCRCGCNRKATIEMNFRSGPNPGNKDDRHCNCGCHNRPGNDDNKGGCRCGPNREGDNKMERKHEDDWDDDNENEDDYEDND